MQTSIPNRSPCPQIKAHGHIKSSQDYPSKYPKYHIVAQDLFLGNSGTCIQCIFKLINLRKVQYIPLKNIQPCDNLVNLLPSLRRKETVQRRSRVSCGRGTIWQEDRDSDNKSILKMTT